jgi:uncharacterized protein (DUF2062 family)
MSTPSSEKVFLKPLKPSPFAAIELAVNTKTDSAAQTPRLLIVLFEDRPAESVARMANAARETGNHLLIIGTADRSFVQNTPSLHAIEKKTARTKALVQTAIQTAARLEATHVMTLGAMAELTADDLAVIATSVHDKSDAVIVGRPDPATASTDWRTRWRRRWGNFWYRMQTGIALDDIHAGLCIYPLSVLNALTFNSRPRIFEIQAPVKAAWAGVEIAQVMVPGLERQIVRKLSWTAAIMRVMMTVHLTMRAITPLPHPKIVSDRKQPHKKISVIHPLRSIKALLTENTTPWQLCLATIMGVFLGALPLIAVHTIVILFAAGFFRLNKVAALAASQLCMPPIVPALCIEAGYYLRFGEFLTEISIETLGYQAIDRVYEWLLGSLLLGPGLAVLAGAVVYVAAVMVRRNLV